MANTDINVGLGAPSENEPALSYVIDWKQLVDNAPSDEAASDTQTYQLFPLRPGVIIRDVYAYVEENFAGLTSPIFSIGDSDSVNGFMTAQPLEPVLADRGTSGNGAYFQSTDTTSSNGETDDVTVTLDSTINSKIYSYDDTSTVKYFVVRFQGPGGKLGTATAGRLKVIVDVIFGNLL